MKGAPYDMRKGALTTDDNKVLFEMATFTLVLVLDDAADAEALAVILRDRVRKYELYKPFPQHAGN